MDDYHHHRLAQLHCEAQRQFNEVSRPLFRHLIMLKSCVPFAFVMNGDKLGERIEYPTPEQASAIKQIELLIEQCHREAFREFSNYLENTRFFPIDKHSQVLDKSGRGERI